MSLIYATPSTSLHVGTANSLTPYSSSVLSIVSNGISEVTLPLPHPAVARSIAAMISIRVVKFRFTPLFILLEACTSDVDIGTLKVLVFIEQPVNLCFGQHFSDPFVCWYQFPERHFRFP